MNNCSSIKQHLIVQLVKLVFLFLTYKQVSLTMGLQQTVSGTVAGHFQKRKVPAALVEEEDLQGEHGGILLPAERVGAKKGNLGMAA